MLQPTVHAVWQESFWNEISKEREMRRAIALTVLAMTSGLFGCGSDPVRTMSESVTIPAIGNIETRGVGEKLVSQYTGQLVPELELHERVVLGERELGEGTYSYEGENSKGTYFFFQDRNRLFYVSKSGGQVCDERGKICTSANYSMNRTLSTLSPSSFQQTLLYNGRIGNQVRLAYREFSDNLARPAFSNEVDYDLSESMIVGYQGARLEIINATNTEITYKVLSGFSR